jgi:hypothetical protein
LKIEKTRICDVGNPDVGLGQAEKWWVKLVNVIPTFPYSKMNLQCQYRYKENLHKFEFFSTQNDHTLSQKSMTT